MEIKKQFFNNLARNGQRAEFVCDHKSTIHVGINLSYHYAVYLWARSNRKGSGTLTVITMYFVRGYVVCTHRKAGEKIVFIYTPGCTVNKFTVL